MRRVIHAGVAVVATDIPAFRQYASLNGLMVREAPALTPDRAHFLVKIPADRRAVLEDAFARYSALRDHEDPKLRQPLTREECQFTPRELDDAALLAVRIRRAPAGHPDHSRCYQLDFSRHETNDLPIPWCWQASAIKLARRELPAASAGLVEALSGFVLVTGSVVAAAAALRTPNALLHPIIDRTTGQPLDWWHLACKRRLPPLHAETTGMHVGAPTGPGGLCEHFDSMDEGFWPAVGRAALLRAFPELPDVTFTHELYGAWHATETGWSTLPNPRLVVSQRLRRELRAAKVTRLEFTPLRVID